MSVHGPYERPDRPWKAAYRGIEGKQKSEWFASQDEARGFDALPKADKVAFVAVRAAGEPRTPVAPEATMPAELPEGVFAYETAKRTRYRFNSHRTSRRGFTTPEKALKAKGRFEERYGRGEVAVGRMSFEPTWNRYLADKKPRITSGSYENLERDGRNNILPFFALRQLQAIDTSAVEEWMEPVH
jgi:hypothetical protein